MTHEVASRPFSSSLIVIQDANQIKTSQDHINGPAPADSSKQLSYLDPDWLLHSEARLISHPDEFALKGSEGNLSAWPDNPYTVN